MLRLFRFTLTTGTVIAALSSLSAAHAAATFNWVPISGGSGTLVLSDAAVHAGTVSFDYDHGGNDGTELNAPVVSFSFGSPAVTESAPDHFFGYGSFHLTIDGDRLSGSIVATDISQDVSLCGGDALWTVSRYDTDNPFSSCHPHGCSGQTWYWQLQSPPPSNVPEPATAVLLLAGLGAAFARRRA